MSVHVGGWVHETSAILSNCGHLSGQRADFPGTSMTTLDACGLRPISWRHEQRTRPCACASHGRDRESPGTVARAVGVSREQENLRCPVDMRPLRWVENESVLLSSDGARRYPVVDGIPARSLRNEWPHGPT